jgi:type IV secretory pathway protease TraF
MRAEQSPAVGLYARVPAIAVAPAYVRERPIEDRDALLLKRIAAAGGDRVCVETDTVVVSRVFYRRAWRDAHGRTLPHWSGCRRLREGEFFLMGDAEASFDSRYWGPVPTALIQDVWAPVFVEAAPLPANRRPLRRSRKADAIRHTAS